MKLFIQEVQMDIKQGILYKYQRYVIAIICLVCGLVCVFCPLGVLKQFIMLVGIVLIINGALNLWIAVTATRAAKDYRRRTETVDTEFVENEGDRDETDGI